MAEAAGPAPLTPSALAANRVEELAEELQLTIQDAVAKYQKERSAVLLEFEAARVQLHTEFSQKLYEADVKLKEILDQRADLLEPRTRQSDVVTINVGGQLYTVKRETLCVCRGSFLSELFSGKWEQELQRDSKGNPFLDVDPSIFEIILAWLRDCKIETPDRPAATPTVPRQDLEHFQATVDYLGLRPFLAVPGLGPDGWSLSSSSTSPGTTEAPPQRSGLLGVAGSLFASLRGTAKTEGAAAAAAAKPASPKSEKSSEAAVPKRPVGWSLRYRHQGVTRGEGDAIAEATLPDTRLQGTAAAVRGTRGYQSGTHYWEVTVTSMSDVVFIGLVSQDWSFVNYPVGQVPESWGVTSAGAVFACQDEIMRLPVEFEEGSVVGFLVELEEDRRVASVFIDGRCFFELFAGLPATVYPAVSNTRRPAKFRLTSDIKPPGSEEPAWEEPPSSAVSPSRQRAAHTSSASSVSQDDLPGLEAVGLESPGSRPGSSAASAARRGLD